MTDTNNEPRFVLHNADSEEFLRTQQPENSIDCIFTSPEPIRTYAQFIKTVLILGVECRRVLKPTGSMWVNMEDAFEERGTLMRWPAKFSIEMVSEYDWILRAERIWHLPVGGQNYYNGGKIIDNNRLILDHSYVYHFTRSRHGYYNSFEEMQGQPCSIFTEKAGPTFSTELIKQSLLMSCPKGGTVMDPFCGTAVTGFVALSMTEKEYSFIGIDTNYAKLEPAIKRLSELQQ